jgi:2'-hydroxyisoflavone reductase
MPIGNNIGSALTNNEKAKENGLAFRPLVDSVKDTFNWWNSDAVSQEQRDEVELNPKSILSREASIIKKWKAL